MSEDDLLQGMNRVQHAFAAVPASGSPLDIHVQIQPKDSPETYSVGYLLAVAIPSGGLAWVLGGGLTIPLHAGSTMERS